MNKKFTVFILSLMLILILYPISVMAEIDQDYDDFEDESITVSTTEESTTKRILFGSGNDSETTTEKEIAGEGSGGGSPSTSRPKPSAVLDEEPSEEESTDETSSSEECEHNFVIVGFDCEIGLATIQCSKCKYSYTDYFANHVTGRKIAGQNPENYDAVFDVVNDGVINGKDYALLMQRYYDDFSINDIFDSHEFLYKEKFGYIYATVLMIVCTGCLLLGIRRMSR